MELPPGRGKRTGKSGEAKIIATACGPQPVAMLQEIKQGTTTHGSLKMPFSTLAKSPPLLKVQRG